MADVSKIVFKTARNKAILWLLGLLGPVGIAIVLAVFVTVIVIMAIAQSQAAQAACGTGGQITAGNLTVKGQRANAEQLNIARTIVTEGLKRRNLTERDIRTTLMVAIQESSLSNLSGGDGSSVGVFQETSIHGSVAERMNVVSAVNRFYDRLLAVPDRENKSPLEVALGAQHPLVSAYLSGSNYFPGQDREAEAKAFFDTYKVGAAACASDGLLQPPNMGQPNSLGYVAMPLDTSSNPAYTIYSAPACRYGKPELIMVLYTVAERWKALHPQGKLWIGDLNAAGHKSHKWGVAADLYATTNGSDYVASYKYGSYNRSATIEFGELMLDTGRVKNIWYDDTSVDSTLLSYAHQKNLDPVIMYQGGHDNHMHLDITGPLGPVSEPIC